MLINDWLIGHWWDYDKIIYGIDKYKYKTSVFIYPHLNILVLCIFSIILMFLYHNILTFWSYVYFSSYSCFYTITSRVDIIRPCSSHNENCILTIISGVCFRCDTAVKLNVSHFSVTTISKLINVSKQWKGLTLNSAKTHLFLGITSFLFPLLSFMDKSKYSDVITIIYQDKQSVERMQLFFHSH